MENNNKCLVLLAVSSNHQKCLCEYKFTRKLFIEFPTEAEADDWIINIQKACETKNSGFDMLKPKIMKLTPATVDNTGLKEIPIHKDPEEALENLAEAYSTEHKKYHAPIPAQLISDGQ
ncbi:MAG: hypothetical protein V1707_00895 [bacterium]